ncbi:MAG TPA: DUF1572 domain-containing protein [Niastella sp.]
MNLSQQIAKHFREVYFGDNWTDVNLKDSLADVTWEEATTQIYACNTIATLLFHMNWYVIRVAKVLLGNPLEGHDKDSFAVPLVQSAENWAALQATVFADAEGFANQIEQLPASKLEETFSEEKYGNYYRNIHGIIEHNHYHLGQIVLLKKILRQLDN